MINTAWVLRERLAVPRREGPYPWVWPGSVPPTASERGARAPAQGGEEFGDICSHPLMSRAFAVPCPPRKPQLQEEALQGLAEAAASRGNLSGKNKGLPWKHFQLLRERLPTAWVGGGRPAPRSPGSAGLSGANALSG